MGRSALADTLASSQATGAPANESTLAPLPHRVADAKGHPIDIGDPVAFATELLERSQALLATLEHDVEHLRADRAEERQRIEASYVAECDALEAATDRLGRLQAGARQTAAQKGKLPLLEAALRLGPTLTVADVDEPGAFARLVSSLEAELKAAHGITGGIRMPEIGRLLSDAALAVARMSQRADHLKQRLLDRTDDELQAEGTEARASFEIGLGVLARDLELLDQALPLPAHPWTDPGWDTWEPLDALGAVPTWVRIGTYVHPELADVAIPALLPATGTSGLLVESGGHHAEAVDAVRNLVLRLLAALPPGGARFSFIDPKGLGEAIAPFLGLAEYDAELVAPSALSLEGEIEEHLEALTRHVEWVTAHHLQGRYASLDELHSATGEIVEAYRYLVVLDHPAAFSERSLAMLRAIVESGARCGVTVIVVTDASGRPSTRSGRAGRNQAIPGLTVVKAGPHGLTRDLGRAGTLDHRRRSHARAHRGRARRAEPVRAHHHRHRRAGPPGPAHTGDDRRGVRPAGAGPASPRARRPAVDPRARGPGRAGDVVVSRCGGGPRRPARAHRGPRAGQPLVRPGQPGRHARRRRRSRRVDGSAHDRHRPLAAVPARRAPDAARRPG